LDKKTEKIMITFDMDRVFNYIDNTDTKTILKELVGIMDGKAVNKIKPNIRKMPEII